MFDTSYRHNKDIKIGYVHDYGCEADDITFYRIKNWLPRHWTLVAIDYDESSYDAAISDLTKCVKELDIEVLVGVGVGGFLTLCMPIMNRCVFNPIIDPSIDCPKLGMPPEIVASYEENKYVPGELLDDENIRNFTYVNYTTHDEFMGSRYRNFVQDLYGKLNILVSFHQPTREACQYVLYQVRDQFKYTWDPRHEEEYVDPIKLEDIEGETKVVRI